MHARTANKSWGKSCVMRVFIKYTAAAAAAKEEKKEREMYLRKE